MNYLKVTSFGIPMRRNTFLRIKLFWLRHTSTCEGKHGVGSAHVQNSLIHRKTGDLLFVSVRLLLVDEEEVVELLKICLWEGCILKGRIVEFQDILERIVILFDKVGHYYHQARRFLIVALDQDICFLSVGRNEDWCFIPRVFELNLLLRLGKQCSSGDVARKIYSLSVSQKNHSIYAIYFVKKRLRLRLVGFRDYEDRPRKIEPEWE